MGVGGQRKFRSFYHQQIAQIPIVQKAGWAPRPVWTDVKRNIFRPPPRFEPRNVWTVTSNKHKALSNLNKKILQLFLGKISTDKTVTDPFLYVGGLNEKFKSVTKKNRRPAVCSCRHSKSSAWVRSTYCVWQTCQRAENDNVPNLSAQN
jgi:hypothetical protein